MIESPVTGGPTKLIKTIQAADIVALYAPYVSVSRFFNQVPEVSIYQCSDTGYQFYYPFSVAGDGPFYEELSKQQLYYVPWKAEHHIADTYIKSGDTVLELGCARGDFLVGVAQKKQITAYGTELNDEAKRTASQRGVRFESVTNADVTCAFQVLEHIADVRSFVTQALNATKPGGYIIFGVPNNASLLKDDARAFLNVPPHHMGLWDDTSLAALSRHFPLEVVHLHEEALQPNHYRWYYQVYYGNRLIPFGFLGRIINKVLYELIAKHFIRHTANTIKGHTIVAVYKKK